MNLSLNKRILLSLTWTASSNRDLAQGVYSFAHLGSDWRFTRYTPRQNEAIDFRRLDGAIGNLSNPALRDKLHEHNVPHVALHRGASGVDISSVTLDEQEVGKSAVSHFLDLGLRNLAYLSIASLQGCDPRGGAFAGAAVRAGLDAPKIGFIHSDEKKMQHWLRSLPKPVGVFLFSDHHADIVFKACHDAGLRIPDEIALLGIDNDEIIDNSLFPPLSSIACPYRQMGYEAARILDTLMRQPSSEPVHRLFPPAQIIARASTDTVQIENPAVAQAIAYIRKNFSTLKGVDEVARASGVSRRQLERLFSTLRGQSIRAEITHQRLEQAKRILQNTNITMDEVAARCGFCDGFYFSTVFKKHNGMPPNTYRRMFSPG